VWLKLKGAGKLTKTSSVTIVTTYFVIISVAIFIVFQATVGTDFNRAICRIRHGVPVRPGDFSFLQVHAYRADVKWADGRKQPAAPANSPTLLYLGHANNQIILYDYDTRHTWRIPDNTVIVDLDTSRVKPCGCEGLPACQPRAGANG
jgi:hypothetical protein